MPQDHADQPIGGDSGGGHKRNKGNKGGDGNTEGGGTHRSGSLPRTIAQALRRARNTSSWQPGMCANFVASMYGAVGLGGYRSATDQWANIPDRLQHGGTDAPKGALVFWGGGDGHVAISAGGGWVYTTDFSGEGRVTLVKASDITAQWGKPVLGWSQPYWGGHTVKITGGPGDPPPEARNGEGGVTTSSGESYGGVSQDNLSARELAEEAGWSYSFLKTVPELWHLFQKAVNQNWSPARFISAMRDTKWFQSNSDTMRQAAVLQKTDPATWDQRVKRQMNRLADMAAQMGSQLSDRELRELAIRVLRFGLEDADVTNWLSDYVTRKNGSFIGQAGINEDELRSYANAMGVKVSNDYVKKVIQGMARGDMTFEEAQDRIDNWAASAFPTLSEDILKKGKTVQELADPYIQTMAGLLELNPGEIDLFTPKIRQALMGRDKDNKPAMKTLWEFEQDVRKDDRYQYTKNARDEMDQVAGGVLSSWGFM